jgi:predicted RNA-binding protein YlqC (UPF0109 family)
MSAGRTGKMPVFLSANLQRSANTDSLEFVKQFLEFVIRQLVEFPDEMMLSEIPSGKTTIFRVQLRQTDVGRIIGRNGQTIQAIRALLASSAARHGQRATLEIVE